MIIKDIDGMNIEINKHNGYFEIVVENKNGCAPLGKDSAIKLADAIYNYYGEIHG